MSRHISSCRHGVVRWTFPITMTCEVSFSRAVATFSSSTVTTRVSPDFATRARRACT